MEFEIIGNQAREIFNDYMQDEILEGASLILVSEDRVGSIYNHFYTRYNVPSFDQITKIYQVITQEQAFPIEQICTFLMYQSINNDEEINSCPGLSIIFKDRNLFSNTEVVATYQSDRFHPTED